MSQQVKNIRITPSKNYYYVVVENKDTTPPTEQVLAFKRDEFAALEQCIELIVRQEREEAKAKPDPNQQKLA